jgi:hypothetical protein
MSSNAIMTQEIHGASSFTRMDISSEGDIAVVTGDCIRHLNWHDKNMEMVYSPGRLSNEVDVETIALTLQSFRAPEILCVKFSPATISPNGRALLAASTSLGEIFLLRSPQLGVASSWLPHAELTATVVSHLTEQPELQALLDMPEPPSQFIMTQSNPASSADTNSFTALQHASDPRSSTGPPLRLQESDVFDDAKRKQETVDRLRRKLAEAEAASKYAAAMKAIDANGKGNAQASKDAEEAAASADQAAKAVAAASQAAEEALALTKLLSCNQTAATVAPSPAPVAAQTTEPPSDPAPLLAEQLDSHAAAELGDADPSFSGTKRVRSFDSADNSSSVGTPRTPASYTTKTPGYVSKFAMDSRVPGASDQLARIIKAMQKLFLSERAKLPMHLQTPYGSWNKFTENDQNLMSTCFERVYAAEEECIRNFQLEDVCTTKRLQQHVRIALRKIEGGDYVAESDEVERHLYESAQQASGSFTTPLTTHPAFATGGRTGAGASHDTPLPSLKKQQLSTPKPVDNRAVEKTQGLGGKKHPHGHLLAMQCRSMYALSPVHVINTRVFRFCFFLAIHNLCMVWTLPLVDAPEDATEDTTPRVPAAFLFVGLPAMIVAVRFAGCPPPSDGASYPQSIHSSVLLQSPVTW